MSELAGQLAAPMPARDTIAAAVEANNITLERAAFADGVITWEEMSSALDAWHDCVVDAGHDVTLNVDNQSETYTVSTPIISLPADEGCPDDAATAELLAPIEAAIGQCRTTHVSRTESAFVQQ